MTSVLISDFTCDPVLGCMQSEDVNWSVVKVEIHIHHFSLYAETLDPVQFKLN
jgi:hypothetical protein